MNPSALPPSVYRYNGAIKLLLVLAGLLLECFTAYMSFYFIQHRDLFGATIMLCLQIGPSALFLAGISRCTIEVDEAGISTRAFGVRTISVHWVQIRKITKFTVSGSWGEARDTFRIFIGNRHSALVGVLLANFSGSIAFTDDIRGLRDLLNQIDFYARRHNIPLFVRDVRTTAKTLSSATGRRRQATDRTEIPVTEFSGSLVD